MPAISRVLAAIALPLSLLACDDASTTPKIDTDRTYMRATVGDTTYEESGPGNPLLYPGTGSFMVGGKRPDGLFFVTLELTGVTAPGTYPIDPDRRVAGASVRYRASDGEERLANAVSGSVRIIEYSSTRITGVFNFSAKDLSPSTGQIEVRGGEFSLPNSRVRTF